MIAFDRFLFVRISNWNKVFLTPKRSVLIGFGLIIFFLLLNLNVVFTFGVDFTVNGTRTIQCFYTPLVPESIWSNYWRTVFEKILIKFNFLNITITIHLTLKGIFNTLLIDTIYLTYPSEYAAYIRVTEKNNV